MKNLAIITARMTSTRLPGKVLLKVNKIPMIKILIDRLKKSKLIDDIVVATTNNRSDDILINFLKKNKIGHYRGSEENVLKRVVHASKIKNAKTITLITGDCPLIDYNLVDQCINTFKYNKCDFVSNANIRSFPDGMDVQVFKASSLYSSLKNSKKSKEFEHVTLHMRLNPKKYKTINIVAGSDLQYPKLGLTLDEQGDYLLIKNVIQHFWKKNNKDFCCKEIVEYLNKNKRLLNYNADVKRKGNN
jgi:spore coat polysaccharide biosynthesis protein SpsF